ncbi:MAG: HEAT repeat domain-containing protein, partial [Myxococcales bacterium]|nr:HEAT repeat domain-containing protein [Myxococcales bacterium]
MRTALERAPADVRREALLGLARARHASTEAGNVLVERCLDDEDAAVRQAAFFVAVAARPRLLRQMTVADPAAGKAMAELPRGEGPAEGALTDEDLAPLFAAMACQHPDSAVLGARGLAALGDVRAIGALLQLSREPNARLRRWVVDVLLMAALAIPTDERASGRLSWLLDDEDDTVAFGAFDALSMLATPHGAEGMLDHAEAALRAGRADVRHRALQILIQHRGSERADALLGEALDDESDKVRQEALRTLLAWHTSDPNAALSRGIASRHADVRRTVAERLTKISAQWAKDLLLSVVSDASSEVGLVALEALTKEAADKKRSDVFLMAMHSPRPDVRAAGCKGCHKASAEDLKARLLELVDDEHPEVHIAAIEAVDALAQASAQAKSLDAEAFRQAFGSVFYALRVRAGELLGKRRDERAIEPLKALLSIPKVSQDRPSEMLRQRASRALADVGAPSVVPYYVTLLDDEDGVVREMGARGLATACRPGTEQPLVDALAHADLAVRSWAAEGLARLGDARALGVLAGTLQHEHRPIRIGAILGHVALGPDGVRGLLAGLQDPDRAIQDLTFSVVLARDIALARRGLEPDLLLSALSSNHPEIRFAAARALEVRSADEVLHEVARELVGPKRPERAGDMKSWPEKDEQARLLNVIVAGLASDHPEQRYASARILELRGQPEGFWREARRLATPGGGAKPHTNWEDEAREPKKKDWIRKLFGRRTLPAAQSGTERVLTVLKYAGAAAPRAVPPEDGTTVIDDLVRLLFGAYAGLVRQAPVAGEADETHRVRRDSLDRLAALARHPGVGRETALPIFRRGLSDPNHLVRRQAAAGLASLYPEGALAPMLEQLDSSADDVGRAAVDAVLERALAGDAEARQLAPKTLLARSPKVRAHALGRLPRLFEKGSVEPWFIALECPHADVRLAVVDRLDALPPGGADEGRIAVALGRALESEHADLRMKAAMSLAARGDVRTVDVFAAFLRGEDTAAQATRGLVRLGTSTVRDPQADCAALAARALAARIEEDPDA